ncbi:AAA family ATPase [Streptomyces zaomyceticus]|uniref:AAA family ATPase n=1 Tax=Streptomyces zaomyceticus TaxID=68286 RepID=UPI0034138A38
MTTRILPALGDADLARSLTTLLSQLPDADPMPTAANSAQLIDSLARLAAESVGELPEVVVVHEQIGPVPALELIREVTLRFPSVGVILTTADASPRLFEAAMDSGARGLVPLPLQYEDLANRVQAAAQWSTGVRRHLGHGSDVPATSGGTVVTVSGAKGGGGATLTAVHLALAAQTSGSSTALVDLDLQAGDIASYLGVQFRRSVVDLAAITDISSRVLADAVFHHDTGVALLLAPGEGERGEEVTDRAVRQIVSLLRSRYEVVIVDCGAQMSAAGAAAVEMADTALLLTTPDLVAVRAAKRTVRMWDRLHIRKTDEVLLVVNRNSRASEIQPSIIRKITGAALADTAIPASYKELRGVVDAGRIHELDEKSTVKQALRSLAVELGIVKIPAPARRRGWPRSGARTIRLRRRKQAKR